jgi:hypothetical protein
VPNIFNQVFQQKEMKQNGFSSLSLINQRRNTTKIKYPKLAFSPTL